MTSHPIRRRWELKQKAEMALKYPANKDPFLEDNDDDFSFASQGRSSRSQQSKGQNYSPWEEPQDEYSRPKSQAELFQEQKQLAMNRQLDSTQRIMGSIYDSERVGIATAEVKLEKYTCEKRGRLLSVCLWVRCMCVNKVGEWLRRLIRKIARVES